MAVNAKSKLRVFQRDNFTCVNCGSHRNLTIDHIEPRSKGGSDNEENLRTMCRDCNVERGDHNPNWWQRIFSHIFTRKEADRMRNDLRLYTVQQNILLRNEIKAHLNKNLDKIKPAMEEIFTDIRKNADIKISGINNSINGYGARSEERDKYLRKLIFLLSDKVEELEAKINK